MLDQLLENPIGTAIGGISLISIIGGLAMGTAKGSFNPDPAQTKLEGLQQASELRKQSIEMANQIYDAGCEGVFYLKAKADAYQPLSKGTGILSGEYWKRYNAAPGAKPAPNVTDYLPAGTNVCDAYGNAVTLSESPKGFGTVGNDLVNTPDRSRIDKMMARYGIKNAPRLGA